MNFSEGIMFYLKDLRKEHGLKRSELAAATGIHQCTLANYENETRQAPYETLVLLADFFHVSIDELLGHTVLPLSPNEKPAFQEDEKNLLKKYRSLSQKDKERLEDYLSLLINNK